MQCPNCGRELKDGAKFCGGCGTRIEMANPVPSSGAGVVCPNCGKQLKPGAKFCGGCGTKIGDVGSPTGGNANEKGLFSNMINHFRRRDGNDGQTELAQTSREDIDVSGDCLHWNVLSGQLALKIDYKTLDGYGNVKGIIIQEGARAIVFANGAYVGELKSGRYMFKNLAPVSPQDPKSGFRRIVAGIRDFFTNERAKRLEGHEDITFVLIRDASFPLIFEFENIVTGQVTSSKVALHALAKITNVVEFYKQLLLDREFVSFEFVAKSLEVVFKTVTEQILHDKNPDQISSADSISAIQQALSTSIAQIYPFITVANVIRITADNAELAELRAMREELYIAEEKLKELQKRNNYLNRLTDENNAQILRGAQTQADFTVAMDKIDQQNLLTDDEKARFAMTLHAQRVIREAQSDDEVQAAMAEFKKAGILRDSELEDLAHQVSQKRQLRDLNDVQAINLLTLQNERVIDTEKLAWEIEVGNKRIENQIERQRMMDAYKDSRREADAAFEDSRRRAQIDIDKEEQMNQLEMLRQAQAIRMEREDAEHKRELDKMEAQRQAHKDDLDAELEKNKIYAGMSAEQIMAANPDISPAAAAALAAKFSNENAVEAQKQINEAQKQSNEQMMGMMQQFMAQMQADKAADREQQIKYMEMMTNQNNVQMQQMGAMASNMSLGKSQEINARLKDKDDELSRMDKSSEKHQDRMLDAMQTTVKAVASIKTPNVTLQSEGRSSNSRKDVEVEEKSLVCPNCGATLEPGESFCGECGTAL